NRGPAKLSAVPICSVYVSPTEDGCCVKAVRIILYLLFRQNDLSIQNSIYEIHLNLFLNMLSK
ncbi:MAG TPA: hypothetical protein DCG04_04755, partial [Rhodospirillaceae bacterium]|nr:hypothetical protein [Rhodospirillaceae bacterium]